MGVIMAKKRAAVSLEAYQNTAMEVIRLTGREKLLQGVIEELRKENLIIMRTVIKVCNLKKSPL